MLVLGAVVLAIVGLAGRFMRWPLLTTTLGPTLYVFLAHPDTEPARLRSAVVGHSTAVTAGLVALAVFGLWNAPSLAVLGHATWRQALAAGGAVGVTLAVLELTRTHHAPSAATALLVATGISHPGKPLFGLLIGLGGIIAISPWLGRLPWARRATAKVQRQ